MVKRTVSFLAALSMSVLPAAASPGFELTGCAMPAGKPLPGSGAVIHVDQSGEIEGSHETIQEGVDAAVEGDTVLIWPGTYAEEVVVTTPGLRIRGTDRDGVILDGGTTRQNGILVTADRVVIENMSGHDYRGTVFFWVGVTGYMGRYLTGYNTNDYGVYAFDARCGQITDSYASGNADSGFYIGQCFPCDAVIDNVVAEENALGYSGTNAGGNLTIRNSTWHNNGLGIVPNTLDSEAGPPQRGATFVNNIVTDNNNRTAPGRGIQARYFGGGILLAGGNNNLVINNQVTGHELVGILVTPLPDDNLWIPSGNVIRSNTVSGLDGSFDLAQGLVSGPGNCWSDNDFDTSMPLLIEEIWDCGFTMTPPGGSPLVEALLAYGQTGLNGRAPVHFSQWPDPTNPVAFVDQPDDDDNDDYTDDGAVDAWLPLLGLN